jgi:uncharacterized protein YbaR (Trm112 family)
MTSAIITAKKIRAHPIRDEVPIICDNNSHPAIAPNTDSRDKIKADAVGSE